MLSTKVATIKTETAQMTTITLSHKHGVANSPKLLLNFRGTRRTGIHKELTRPALTSETTTTTWSTPDFIIRETDLYMISGNSNMTRYTLIRTPAK